MAGIPSGGQTLTPNPNVNAPAGFGGDLWGANGGGITPVGGGVTGQTGYDKPVAVTLSDAETQTNYQTGVRKTVEGDLGTASWASARPTARCRRATAPKARRHNFRREVRPPFLAAFLCPRRGQNETTRAKGARAVDLFQGLARPPARSRLRAELYSDHQPVGLDGRQAYRRPQCVATCLSISPTPNWQPPPPRAVLSPIRRASAPRRWKTRPPAVRSLPPGPAPTVDELYALCRTTSCWSRACRRVGSQLRHMSC